MKTTISTIHAVIAVAAVSIFLPVGSAAADDRRRAESNAAIVPRNLFSPVISAASGVVGFFSHDHRRRKIQEETSSGTAVPTFSLSNLDDILLDAVEDLADIIDDAIEYDDDAVLAVDEFANDMIGALLSPEVFACVADTETIQTSELLAVEKEIADYSEDAFNQALENLDDQSSSSDPVQVDIPEDLVQAHEQACEDAGGVWTLYSKFDCGGDNILDLGLALQVDTGGFSQCFADTETCNSLDLAALAGSVYESIGMTCTSEISSSGTMPVEIIGDDGVGDTPTTDDPEEEDAVTKEGDAAATSSAGSFCSSSAAMALAATTTFVGSIVL